MAKTNTVTLIGNLGLDPETRKTATTSYVRFTLATTDSYKDEQSGTWRNRQSVWHTVFAFGPQVAGYARSYRKGDRIKVTGSLSYQTTEAFVDRKKRRFTTASVLASRIEDARLPRTSSIVT